MRWGLRASRQQPREVQHPRREQEQQESRGKSKAVFSSFSPLAWLSKLTAKNSAAAAKPEHATPGAAKSTPQAAAALPSRSHRRGSPSTASQSSTADSSPPATAAGTAPRRDDTEATASDIAPRRRSVGNDDTESEAAAARHMYHRRHYSVGGDRDLPPLGHLVSFSRSASPKPPPTPAPVRTLTPMLPPLPSDTDEEKRPRSRRRRHRRVSGRRSFSGKAPGARVAAAVVRVRSPRPGAAAAVSELERFAVVRRTRDPQREFRASMVEMIASKRMVGRPDELETLLACYLSLNADEHHDCIVKVFRQVWFELNNPARAAAARLAS
ncbi:transcription repressor OFP1-like [Phragmites australis]|uniref:transcription repressor OFP1-like n=1 Tax=Phragmites australis TaxID=29695 RepID=UPI002D77C800|nr:transcription repressor OFP1-like [Phragmites australis]